MAELYLFREEPKPCLRPFAGGDDVTFNTRWKTVVPGVTVMGPENTGVLEDDELEPMYGSITVTEGLHVFVGKEIFGHIRVQGTATVLLYRCRVRNQVDPGSNHAAIMCQSQDAQVSAIDCDVTTDVFSVYINCFLGGNIYALRCKVWGGVDLFSIYRPDNTRGDMNVRIIACYGFDLLYGSPDPNHADDDNATHNDCVQIQGGSGAVILGCTFNATLSPNSFVDPGGHPPEGKYGQGVTVTATRSGIDSFSITDNILNYGVAAVIVVGTVTGITGGDILRNKCGPDINPAAKGDGGPIIVTRTLALTGIAPTANAGASPDATNGNTNLADGSPALIYRR